MRPLQVALVALLPVVANAEAVDWRNPRPSGGLRVAAPSTLRLVQERVEIEAAAVPKQEPSVTFAIEYRIANDTAAEIAGEVIFAEPDIEWRGLPDGTPAVGSPRFWANGAPVTPRRDMRALKGDVEVTSQLAAMGVPADGFPGLWEDPPEFWRKLGPEKLAKLEAVGLLIDFVAQWRASVTHRWTQHIPPKTEVVLRVRYVAMPGCCVQALSWIEKPGCVNAASLAAMRQTAFQDAVTVAWPTFSFDPRVLPGAAIPEFELQVTHPAAWQASLCWGGPIERVSATRARAHASNYSPPNDLTVFFFPH